MFSIYVGLMADAKVILLIEGGGGRLATLLNSDSIGFAWTHLGMLGLVWTHLDSDEVTCTNLDSLGLTRIHCDSLCLTGNSLGVA